MRVQYSVRYITAWTNGKCGHSCELYAKHDMHLLCLYPDCLLVLLSRQCRCATLLLKLHLLQAASMGVVCTGKGLLVDEHHRHLNVQDVHAQTAALPCNRAPGTHVVAFLTCASCFRLNLSASCAKRSASSLTHGHSSTLWEQHRGVDDCMPACLFITAAALYI